YSMERQSVGRAILGGQGGLFVMKTSGEGTLLVAAFGSIKEIDLQDAHDFTIDNAHVVAWETSLTYDIHLEGGGLIGSIGTGEGVVNTFNGTGKVLVQSLNLENFANMLKPFMPQPSSN
ncbi:MAG: AIM24 family protein, partial [Weissella cibaria]